MRWPFGKPVEARSNYTDSITDAILAAASTATATADGTAALEAASGLLSRGFSSRRSLGRGLVTDNSRVLGPRRP